MGDMYEIIMFFPKVTEIVICIPLPINWIWVVENILQEITFGIRTVP